MDRSHAKIIRVGLLQGGEYAGRGGMPSLTSETIGLFDLGARGIRKERASFGGVRANFSYMAHHSPRFSAMFLIPLRRGSVL